MRCVSSWLGATHFLGSDLELPPGFDQHILGKISIDFYGKLVGKYTSPMDPTWIVTG